MYLIVNIELYNYIYIIKHTYDTSHMVKNSYILYLSYS
jgi:hypothetical protein